MTTPTCPEHGNDYLMIVETGYVRSWRVSVGDDGNVTAFYDGSSDWSECGAGDDHFECSLCLGDLGPISPDDVTYS